MTLTPWRVGHLRDDVFEFVGQVTFTEVTGYGVVLNSEVTPVGQQKDLPLKMVPSDLVNALFNSRSNGYFFVANEVSTNKPS